MGAPVPPGTPSPDNPFKGPAYPNYDPSIERTPDLSQNFQNLNVNQLPNAIPSGSPPSSFGLSRPSPTGQTPPFQAAGPPAYVPAPSSLFRPNSVPPGPVARVATPPIRPPPNAPPGPLPNLTPGRPSSAPLATESPPFALRPPQGLPHAALSSPSRPSSGGIVSSPNAPFFVGPQPISNGLPGSSASGPRFPLSGGPQRPAGPPQITATATLQSPPLPSTAPSLTGGEISASPGTAPPFSSLSPAAPFSSRPQFVAPTSSPFGSQTWRTQPQAPLPLAPGFGSPLGTYGIPPSLPQAMGTIPPAMGHTGLVSGPNKIDPNQIPHPVPSSSVILHETRLNNQANPPPPATSTYIVQDTGNCSPRYMRCTINQVPCTSDILVTSGMQLALLVQPLALPHPSEEPVQVVDFGEGGPVRCSRCKGYINPFMKFINHGRQFICNFCGNTDETPQEYLCNLGPDGRRRDAYERPELCRGTVEFIASREYMTGATAAACSAINQVIVDLPEGPRTMVGIATFDSTIHFYNLKRALQQPLMLIVPDIQDVYTPLETDVIVPLSECREHLESLLESIPTMYQSSKIADSAFGAAMKAAFLAMKNRGGKLLVFQSVLPSVGTGALSARETEGQTNITAGEKDINKLLLPQDIILKEMAIEFAEHQVCVDVFMTAQSYVDIASISVVPRTTGGECGQRFTILWLLEYGLKQNGTFKSLQFLFKVELQKVGISHYLSSASLEHLLSWGSHRPQPPCLSRQGWNLTRPQGFEAVMRVRCSQGLEVQEYFGNFCKRMPTDIDLPGVDSDKTIMATLKINDKLQDGAECAFQCALLYTTVYGQRRIRVSTLSLPCTSNISYLFRTADLDTQFGCHLKRVATEIPRAPLTQLQDQVTKNCTNILHSYRKYCATASSSGQLILPEALKLLPLYTLALLKSTGFRSDGRIDNRSLWITHVCSVSASLAIPLVYPRMISVHDLTSKEYDQSIIPTAVPLSSEHVRDEGIYLLENGMDALIHVGSSVDPHLVEQIFGTSVADKIPNQFVLQQYDNPLSKRLNEVVNEIRRERCSYLSFRLCKKGNPSGVHFFSHMVEDKTPTGFSYVEFLVHIHKRIQSMMS